jgi:hypothetical protein
MDVNPYESPPVTAPQSALGIVLPVAFTTLTAYLLSAGPVGWCIIQAGRPLWLKPIFESVYAAAFWVQHHEPTSLLTTYYNWWW